MSTSVKDEKYTIEEIKAFVQWAAREGWVYNWKTDKYEYRVLQWRPRTFEELFEQFLESSHPSHAKGGGIRISYYYKGEYIKFYLEKGYQGRKQGPDHSGLVCSVKKNEVNATVVSITEGVGGKELFRIIID